MLTNNLSKISPAHRGSKKPLAGRRILLAEDEALIALDLERMLEDLGCDVVGPVASVEDVLETAERGGFDGALLDVNLRGRQIFEILPKLQKLGLQTHYHVRVRRRDAFSGRIPSDAAHREAI